MPLEVGAQAPEFTLKDQNNQPVSLSDYRGRKNVLLIFVTLLNVFWQIFLVRNCQTQLLLMKK